VGGTSAANPLCCLPPSHRRAFIEGLPSGGPGETLANPCDKWFCSKVRLCVLRLRTRRVCSHRRRPRRKGWTFPRKRLSSGAEQRLEQRRRNLQNVSGRWVGHRMRVAFCSGSLSGARRLPTPTWIWAHPAAFCPAVGKTPSWPKSWANFSLQKYMGQLAIFWANLTPSSLVQTRGFGNGTQVSGPSRTHPVGAARFAPEGASASLSAARAHVLRSGSCI
jgi:hypothetical protein